MTDKDKLEIAIRALKQCSHPAGAYDMDKLRHAENTIRDTAKLAKKALDEIGEDYSNVEIEQ